MTQLQNDIQTIVANLQNQNNAPAFLENILLNHAAVQSDITTASAALKSGDWKSAGQAIGDFSRLVLLHVNSLSNKNIS